MPVATPSYSLGTPVEIGRIQQELKKIWDAGEGAMTRASLMNLAVYSEAKGSLQKNTDLISRLTEDHACRAIVIGADPSAKENRVEAWVSAHCHVRAGNKQICSEQLSFLLEGPCTSLLPNIVFSHLDSDLPFYLWWQGELHDPMDPQLWAWVDRLLYDSHDWKNFDAQLKLVETAQEEAKQRIVLCDLNWTRLDKMRLAIAQFFDHPASHYHFDEIESVGITFAQDYRSTALLLVGWLAAQLEWKLDQGRAGSTGSRATGAGDRNQVRFTSSSNQASIEVELVEIPDTEPIDTVVIQSHGVAFRVSHAQCGDLLEVSRDHSGEETLLPQLMPAQDDDPVELMSQELLRGGPHRVYLRAINCVRDLL